MTYTHQKKGFTLIELLLYMGMFSVILLVLTSLFAAIVDTQLDVQATSAVESDSKFITSRLMYDINRAQSVTTPAALGEEGSALTLVIDGVVTVYSLNSGNMHLTVGADIQNLNSEGSRITSATFTRLGNSGGKPAIRVLLTLESTTGQAQDPERKTVDITIGLR
jgi:type II secretory pathway pseudopilin PulG